jgi:hypothetical protein
VASRWRSVCTSCITAFTTPKARNWNGQTRIGCSTLQVRVPQTARQTRQVCHGALCLLTHTAITPNHCFEVGIVDWQVLCVSADICHSSLFHYCDLLCIGRLLEQPLKTPLGRYIDSYSANVLQCMKKASSCCGSGCSMMAPSPGCLWRQ